METCAACLQYMRIFGEMKSDNRFAQFRNLLIFLNLMFLILLCVLRVKVTKHLPATLYLLLVGSAYFIIPVVLLISWWKCLTHYLNDKFELLSGRDTLKNKMIILGYVALVFALSIPLWISINDLIVFVSRYLVYIEKLMDCVLIKVLLIGGWSFCFLKSIKILKLSGTENKIFYKRIILYILLVIVLLYIRMSTSEYISVRADDMWYEWLHEQGEAYLN